MKLEVAPQSSGCEYTKQVRVGNSFNRNFSQIVDCSRNRNEAQKNWWWNKSQWKSKVLLWKLRESVGQRFTSKTFYMVQHLWLGTNFNCSGLQRVDDCKKTLDFLCSKCAVTRKLVDPTAESLAYSKLHTVYTSCNNPGSFAGRNALKKESKCSYRQVDNYLNRSETYIKFKQTRKCFPRLKVQSFRLNEIWSVDLADMQKLNFTFVAVDALSRFVWALPLRKRLQQNVKMRCKKSWKPFARENTVQQK